MGRAARLAKWLGGLLAALLVTVVLGTLVPRPLTSPAAASVGSSSQILLLANPIHTDIALPLDNEVRAAFADLIPAGLPIDMPGVEYLIIGWGGRSFYIETPTWGDIRPLPVLKALTIDRSVLHASVAGAIDESNPSVRPLDITYEGRSRMIAAIRASFVRENGEPVPIPEAAYGFDDAFFEAEGSFNAFVGCNTWTASMLRSAGIRTGWWTPLPQLLDLSIDLHHGA
ncbi:MAG: TIGR02117 family protein [Allorhizobium sp.]|uniref:TIGR02117 family protein n=1 Tax=Allorhizobium sp. TaxID=633478 RepID=UPI004034C758